MAYEVDIMAVGDESQSGDAIALRFGNFVNDPSDQTVVVIDGGFKESGEKLVKHIRDVYKTNHVDLVISTHPDNDHVSGLHVVLEELSVGELWMHRPWNMSQKIKSMAEDNRGFTAIGLSSKLKKSLESAYDLEKLANEKGVPKIIDPFQGQNTFGNVIHVLGPSQDYYHELVTEFEKGSSYNPTIEKIKRTISEVWHEDGLSEPEEDSVNARNNSSVILRVLLDGDHFLFTGDAGSKSLHLAVDYADNNNYSIKDKINFYQIPHHGSKKNVGPSILNRIIGPILNQGQKINKNGFISAATKSHPKHPSPLVVNAYTRRGVDVSVTAGSSNCFRSLDVPVRDGWSAISYLEFNHSFEEEV